MQRASEHSSHGDSNNFDASSILAALPPGLGQAASALTSFASSFKRSNATDREDGEGMEGDQNDEDVKKEQEAAEGNYEHHHPEGQGGDEYQDEAAAIAAMSSLSAQQTMLDQKPSGSRNKKESGPEAERARKDQHKEVERKRRELISNGITELAAIVPGCDAKGVNKTAIINAAVRYIQELKNNEASNIEKWTLEKLLMDQAMNDLNQHLEASRKQVARLRAELGIEGEPEEMDYQADMESTREQNGENLDPSLQTAAREGAAANALSEVAAAAAAAAADASNASAEALAEAAVEQATEEKKAEGGRARGRGRPEAVAKEETTRSKRARV